MSENSQATIPPPNAGSGCCGMGCATLFGLILFFGLAFFGGGMWAVHHYKHKYTSAEPMELKTGLPAHESISLATTANSPKELEERWKVFEKAGQRNEKAQISLSATQINSLLENNKNTRGKAFVAIENNLARVRVSIPLKKVPLFKGRYLNGEATVKASPDGDPAKAEISSIVLSGASVPDSIMEQHFMGSKSMRTIVADWLEKQNIGRFRIENNLVTSETRGE